MKAHVRRVRRWGAALAALVVLVVLAEASCRSAPPRRRPEIGPDVTEVERWVPPPVLRVGIVLEASRVSIAADSGVVLAGGGAAAGSEPLGTQRATFVGVRPAGVGAETWRIQIASLADDKAAGDLMRRARERLRLPAVVRRNAATETHQVRVGEWPSRDEAKAGLTQLAQGGFPGGWVVDDSVVPGATRVRVLETGEEFPSVLVFPAQSGETLTVDGMPFRGLLEVRSEGASGLAVINLVNLEDYLRGVVPNELSPLAYPQAEALKAQAVAARTYALRNRGQFSGRGFDICATPACQVYKGKSSEHELSDQAVAATRGVVVTYRGELINAVYTSTCGGHTEDGASMFETGGTPYLRGVSCAAEGAAWRTIRSSAPAPAARVGGEVAPRDAALLLALGIVDARDVGAPEPPSDADAERWTERLLSASSRVGCAYAMDGPLTRRGRFISHLVGHLCWEERARRLLLADDLTYLLQLEDRAELSGEQERLAAALLIHEKVLAPFGDNTLRPNAALTRAQAFELLAKVAVRLGGPRLTDGEFLNAVPGRLTLRVDGNERAYSLGPDLPLFRSMDGETTAASEVMMAPGDPVRLVEDAGQVLFFEGQQSRMGVAADRGSKYYRWEVRSSPADVARGIAKHGSVGTVLDVVPRRRGVSGRVVELAVVGTQGEIVLKGLAIRWALGLRENFFVIDREVDRSGGVRRFIFNGKGWGHGVGLCQVGAAALAQAGQTYEGILRHYYSGVELETRN